MKRTIFLTALAFLFLIFVSSEASACSCSVDTQEETFKKSELVFIGKFIKTSSAEVKIPDSGAQFKITKSWKGKKTDKTLWISYIDFGGCGYDIELIPGKKYLIYAVRIEEKLTMEIDCGRIRKVEEAAEDIKNMKKVAKKQN